LDENAAGQAAIIVTELANNLQKHAQEGSLVLRRINAGEPGIAILAVDKGPGMTDVEKCLRDGYSTIGTPGTGLGSIARLADRWDIYSIVGIGTVLMAQVGGRDKSNASRLDVGAVTLPMKGEVECGDNWAHTWNAARERVMVADGLGHGEHAWEAAKEAATIFCEKEGHPLPDVMQAIHNGLKKTRGAAVALAEMDAERRIVQYVGVGNIAATILHAATTRSLVSQNGTVGHEARKIQEFQYPWPEGATLVMNSDGILTKWELSKYPGLVVRHPALIAGVIWRDFTRGRDDTLVIAARERAK
jgi:anti-sigma regulatory factor (Ser/Thr protein kinase)